MKQIKLCKQSISMKYRSARFRKGSILVPGFYVKFRKGIRIMSFKCITETKPIKSRTIIEDNDVQSDDEQIYLAQKNMFLSLCQSLQEDILEQPSPQ